MENPWLEFVGDDHVHPLDVAGFARIEGEKGLTRSLLPEPYIGRLDAPVVVLMNNPKAGENDTRVHATDWYRVAHRDNLLQRRGRFPFYYLDPELRHLADEVTLPARRDRDQHGWAYWDYNLKSVLAQVPRETVARNLLVVQAFPYHSDRMSTSSCWRLPTVSFNAEIVRRAAAENRVIVTMRKGLIQFFPELDGVGARPRSVQQASLSPGNMGPAVFDAVVAALSG